MMMAIEGGGHDAGTAEDQLDPLGQAGEHCAVGTQAVAQAQSHGDNRHVPGSEGLLGDELDTAHYDGGNIITAAPPSTLWGMMDTMAASLGSRPHSTRQHGAARPERCG